jgi:hypothetical protein
MYLIQDKDNQVYMAKLAEQAERYDGTLFCVGQ